ncbi:hypothetical protein [Pseudodesulfovibrio piezophilus]|uniref:Uncharacterized protein n=1 Tax=Pseudodesulfovibrio piezophilus (strain DSM 21447 / JCM 15486 / C1TLV30) TaxID=1322246 RepID=M1WP68_PSEP2|nr:hypothetical protein [Pseudodesulfovibrio piezophilus]CCH48094.1 conserved protein of unknown function [Pseudodesulfovibrio piezophilus C1TLV30]
MNTEVMEDLKLAFACDLYETIKAARKNHEETVFRHTMTDEAGQMVFAAMFPKKEIMEFPNLTDEFVEKLKTFNLLGVVTDGESGLDMFHLGGMNKPFTTLTDARSVTKCLTDEPFAVFLQMYFQIKGVMINIDEVSHEEFLAAVESEVFKNTSFSQMQEAGEFLKAFKN